MPVDRDVRVGSEEDIQPIGEVDAKPHPRDPRDIKVRHECVCNSIGGSCPRMRKC